MAGLFKNYGGIGFGLSVWALMQGRLRGYQAVWQDLRHAGWLAVYLLGLTWISHHGHFEG